MTPQAVQSLLNYGAMGFAAVALLMGAYVLRSEQSRRGKPRISLFIAFGTFGLLLFAGSLWREVALDARVTRERQIETLNREKEDLSRKVSETVDSVGRLQKQLGEEGNKTQALLSDLKALEAKLGSTGNSAKQHEQESAKLRRELTDTLEKLNAAEADSRALRTELAQVRESASAKEEANAALRRQYEATVARLDVYEKRYSCEESLPRGRVFFDKFTGVSVGIVDVTTFGSMHGSLTTPDGKNERISLEPSGKAWPYKWNGRSFVVSASPAEGGQIVYSVREVSELKQ